MLDPFEPPAGGDRLDAVLARAREGDEAALDALLQAANAGNAATADVRALTGLVQLGLQQGMDAACERLMTFARRYLIAAASRHRRHSGVDPESVAHHGIAKLWERRPVLREYTAQCFLAYLDQMAHNDILDRERKRNQHKETTLGGESDGHHKPPMPGRDVTPAMLSKEGLEFLLSRCAAEEEQLILRMRYEEVLSHADIGARLSPPKQADAVRMQIQRLLVRLGQDPTIQREYGA